MTTTTTTLVAAPSASTPNRPAIQSPIRTAPTACSA